MPDVRIDAREGELQRAYAGMTPELEERPPAGGSNASLLRDRFDDRQITSEPYVQKARASVKWPASGTVNLLRVTAR